MKFVYTIIYVENVLETIAFYEKAFDCKKKFIHESNQYGELETGAVTLAFASYELSKMNFSLAIEKNARNKKPAGFEIAFVTQNIQKDFDKALAHGAEKVLEPTQKPWGQTVAFVRDNNGILVELATPMA